MAGATRRRATALLRNSLLLLSIVSSIMSYASTVKYLVTKGLFGIIQRHAIACYNVNKRTNVYTFSVIAETS